MPAILTDPAIPAEDLRQRLYRGDLVILTKLCALDKFVEYMRAELTELFAPHDPEHVHEHIEPAEMAKILGVWKPRWIHDERSRELVHAIIAEAGFDPEYTHYDVPKPRTLVDAYCTGTAIRDFVSIKDESTSDEETVRTRRR